MQLSFSAEQQQAAQQQQWSSTGREVLGVERALAALLQQHEWRQHLRRSRLKAVCDNQGTIQKIKKNTVNTLRALSVAPAQRTQRLSMRQGGGGEGRSAASPSRSCPPRPSPLPLCPQLPFFSLTFPEPSPPVHLIPKSSEVCRAHVLEQYTRASTNTLPISSARSNLVSFGNTPAASVDQPGGHLQRREGPSTGMGCQAAHTGHGRARGQLSRTCRNKGGRCQTCSAGAACRKVIRSAGRFNLRAVTHALPTPARPLPSPLPEWLPLPLACLAAGECPEQHSRCQQPAGPAR